MSTWKNIQPGVAALLIVMVIGSAALVIAFTASFFGFQSSQSMFTFSQRGRAFTTAQGCMDETLRRISLDGTYGVGAGQINLSLGDGSCIIEVTDLGGNDREVTVEGSVSDSEVNLQATITRTGREIELTSWEVSN